ncbi:uncharacterized protein METZ01_LOCUS285871, partial [marine metagenome]
MKQITLITLLGSLSVLHAGDWTQFRGPQGNGVSSETGLPTTLSEKNLKWTVELPGRGLSGVLVLGENILVSCSSGTTQTRLHILCLNAKDGSLKWQRQF